MTRKRELCLREFFQTFRWTKLSIFKQKLTNLINTFNEFSSLRVADSINFQPGAFCLRARSFFMSHETRTWLVSIVTNERVSTFILACKARLMCSECNKDFSNEANATTKFSQRILQHEKQSSIRSAAFLNKFKECVWLSHWFQLIRGMQFSNSMRRLEGLSKFAPRQQQKTLECPKTKLKVELSANLRIAVFLFVDEQF